MACGLLNKLDTALVSVKAALTTALDADIQEKELEDILAAYTNLKSVANRINSEHKQPEITFTPDVNLEDHLHFSTNDTDTISIDTSNLDFGEAGVPAASYVTGGLGQDVITFGNDITFTDDIDKDD